MASFNNNSPVGGAQAKKRNAQGPHYTNASFSTKSGGQPGNPYNKKPIGSTSKTASAPAKATAQTKAQTPSKSPSVGRSSPVGGGAQFASSKSASPKVGNNSPVGGGSQFRQSAASVKPDTSNHVMGGGSKLPSSAPRPTAKPAQKRTAMQQIAFSLDTSRPKMSANDFIAKVKRDGP